jgi:hypothetical protein
MRKIGTLFCLKICKSILELTASEEFTGMTDPVTTLTALAIAEFAFKKFFESGVGKLGEKFTEFETKYL